MSPLNFGALAVIFYGLLLLPALLLHRLDPSALIMAGDHFVDAHQLASPIIVHRASTGYDGQFYYRMALAPLAFAREVGGVQFDHPAWRMQRIFYPATAWLLSGGRAAAVPAALLALNLLGLGAIAALAIAVARRAQLAAWVPPGILLWPGFIVALTHDTTEIYSEALVLAALLCRLHGRLAAYTLLAILAVLTREMTLLVFAGWLLWDAAIAWNRRRPTAGLIYGALIPLPALVWHQYLAAVWPLLPQDRMTVHNLGPPFFGVIDMLVACITGARLWASSPAKDLVVRAIVLATAPVLIAFCIAVATKLRTTLHARPALAPLAVSWCLLAFLMSLMTDAGPWIDPAAYFRAFTECYVTGCLVLGSAAVRALPRGVSWSGGAIFATIWLYCLVQLRLP